MVSNNGFIKIPRNFLYWRWYADTKTTRIFLHLLLKANYTKQQWKEEMLCEGQLVTGRRALAQELNMGENEIRGALLRLQRSGDISIKATKKYSVITINNWAELQETSKNFTHQPPNNHPITTQKPPQYKKEKKEKNEKNINKYARSRAKANNGIIDNIDWSLMDEIINRDD